MEMISASVTMNESTGLKALIESDAEAHGHFLASRDQLCADRCSLIAPTVRRPVPAAEIQHDAAISGVWATITLARESLDTPAEIRGICLTFLDWIKSGRPIDFDMPAVQTMLLGLVEVGLVTEQQAIDMDTKASVGQTFTASQVSACRG